MMIGKSIRPWAALVCIALAGCASNRGGPVVVGASASGAAAGSETVIPLGRTTEDPSVRLASYGQNLKKDRPPEVVVNMLWDEKAKECRIVVRGTTMTIAGLKDYLYPVARSAVDPKTKFSKASVLIRCGRDVPFRHVQYVMQTCAHRDIMIPTIAMAVESRLATPLPTDGPLPETEEGRKREMNPARVILKMQGERCICYVDGKSVGVMPGAKVQLGQRLKAMKKAGATTVEITPESVENRYVIAAIEGCRRAKIKSITFTGALPEVKKTRPQR